MIYQHPLGWYIISPWLLILAAILVSTGFHIISAATPNVGLKTIGMAMWTDSSMMITG